jgi:D-3-phosphoglycerate dehydrogenase / 2-oxoglutarate reductase
MKCPVSVAITIRSFDLSSPAIEKLKEHSTISFINNSGGKLTETDLITALKNVQGVIAGTETFSRRVINQSPNLRVISRVGVGTDSIDLDAAQEHGIQIVTTPNSPIQSVAEHTLALLLSALKQIPQYNEQMRKNNQAITAGSLLFGKTVGIVGMGRIGTRVAEILECFGCHVLFYDPIYTKQNCSTWKRIDSIMNLVKCSDILSIHSAPQSDGSPIINAEVLSYANGIIIINTARGSLIDEQSLISALSTGKVKAAALDVFPSEPYTGKLLSFHQVITTPHVASNTVESRRQMELESVDNLIKSLEDAGL